MKSDKQRRLPVATQTTPGAHEHPERVRSRPPLSDVALEHASRLFRALGEASRLRLLERLADGEWCVTELAAAADVGLSTVSQQLRVLKAERLVKQRRDGKHIYYSLADQHVAELILNALAHASEGRRSRPDQWQINRRSIAKKG